MLDPLLVGLVIRETTSARLIVAARVGRDPGVVRRRVADLTGQLSNLPTQVQRLLARRSAKLASAGVNAVATTASGIR
jgi:hypothetical protein